MFKLAGLVARTVRRPNFRGCFRIILPLAIGLLTVSFSRPAFAIDGIGTATVTKLSACPNSGLSNGACYKVVVAGCAGTSQEFIASAKVNQPPHGQASKGTVFFTTGGGG